MIEWATDSTGSGPRRSARRAASNRARPGFAPGTPYRVGRLAPMCPVPRRLLDPFASPVLAGARELAWRRGVAATLALVAGDPAAMITAAAAAAHADVLVIGARSAQRP